MLFAYVVFFWLVLWLGICVEVDVDRINILPPLPIFFPTHNSFFNTSDSYQFEISGRLKLVSVPFSSLVLYIGHLEKSFPQSIMYSSEMGQCSYDSQSLHRPISYYILVSCG